MTAYYNEIDPYAAQWLRNLIAAGHIAPGDVDTRSIEDVTPDDIKHYAQCHFFAGIGVWSYALRRAGWPDDKPVWTGSCPCQPFSAAGKGAGFADERHLWPAWHYLIDECRPPVVFGEQVASKDGLGWLDLVQSDMEATGYALGPIDLCAAGVGAPHIRQRLWFVGERLADASDAGLQGGERVWAAGAQGRSGGHSAERGGPDGLVDAARPSPTNGHWEAADWLFCRDGKWRPVEPSTFPLAHGATGRVGRLRAYGNAIVAQAAQEVIAAYVADAGNDLI
jgi:DNA (cytosine-5)-methyltransferase 1